MDASVFIHHYQILVHSSPLLETTHRITGNPSPSPVGSEPTTGGIEQFIVVNATMNFDGAAADSAITFWSDPEAVTAFESLTKQVFEAGIADPNSNHNTILNKDPELLAVNVVKVINPSTDSIVITFQTTMRLFSDIVLDDQNFLVNLKFGPYWYANPDLTFAYVSSVDIIYPTLFAEEEVYLQIEFGVAESIQDPTPLPGYVCFSWGPLVSMALASLTCSIANCNYV